VRLADRRSEDGRWQVLQRIGLGNDAFHAGALRMLDDVAAVVPGEQYQRRMRKASQEEADQ
jgi:hypothetical protein